MTHTEVLRAGLQFKLGIQENGSHEEQTPMRLVEYENANPESTPSMDDFLAVRKTDWINNFW